MKLPWLDPSTLYFPPTSQALSEPNGLLAAGGQLSNEWLLAAYQHGIFPWFNEDDPILWWTPSPRMVLYPHQFHLSRSLRKALKRGNFRVTINRSFTDVVKACALPRTEAHTEPHIEQSTTPATWITPAMTDAYDSLHQAGYAHSIEVWQESTLAGGLYGVALGEIFFGESMFSNMTNGSKIAIAHLVEWLKQWQYKLIDCQVYSDHLSRLGAIEIDRHTFEQIISRHTGFVEHKLVEQRSVEQWAPREITLPASHWS